MDDRTDLNTLFNYDSRNTVEEFLADAREAMQAVHPDAPNRFRAEAAAQRASSAFEAASEAYQRYAFMYRRIGDDLVAAVYSHMPNDAEELRKVQDALAPIMDRLARTCVEAADLWAEAHAIALKARLLEFEAALGRERSLGQAPAILEPMNQRTITQLERSVEVARRVAAQINDGATRRAWADEKLLLSGLPPRAAPAKGATKGNEGEASRAGLRDADGGR